MAFGKSAGGGRRVAKRVQAPMPALLITMSDRHPALLFDISRTGARLRAKDPPPKGTELFLQAGGVDVYGQVAWRDGDAVGLLFDSEITDWDVEYLRANAMKAGKATLSAAEKGGADDWSNGVAR
jgi:hypothetical protein